MMRGGLCVGIPNVSSHRTPVIHSAQLWLSAIQSVVNTVCTFSQLLDASFRSVTMSVGAMGDMSMCFSQLQYVPWRGPPAVAFGWAGVCRRVCGGGSIQRRRRRGGGAASGPPSLSHFWACVAGEGGGGGSSTRSGGRVRDTGEVHRRPPGLSHVGMWGGLFGLAVGDSSKPRSCARVHTRV